MSEPTHRSTRPRRAFASVLAAVLVFPTAGGSQTPAPDPVSFFGHEIGADYRLVDYDGLSRYWEALAAVSPRMVLDTIGSTELGRPQLMAIVTSPDNQARLAELRDIAARLARGRVENADEARDLAQRGRAVVWIDGGLHATETLGAQQLIESVFQFVSRDDPETLRILDEVVILFVHANPDGHALVADWYLRAEDPEQRSLDDLPVLYQHYAGHDNNRDFYIANLAETRNMNRVMYREWYPQIVYNHHQTGPRGTVMYAPPFRGPANYHLDPMVLLGIDQLGSAMHLRFLAERKPGTVMRSAAGYSTWWNGGLRTAPYYHNMIGLLTETIGSPTPTRIPYDWERYLQTNDTPLPIEPQPWHMRQSVDYSLTANYAVLDYAARNRETLLFNIWRMGRNAIEAGGTDSWTLYPHRWQAIREAVAERSGQREGADAGGDGAEGEGEEDAAESADRERFERYFRHPELRDPRAYVLSADQADYPTATRFVNALIRTGVEVHRATAEFTLPAAALGGPAVAPGGALPWEADDDDPDVVTDAGGRAADRSGPGARGAGGREASGGSGAAIAYPAGSYVVFAGQAFRAQVLDMFEPQDHPDDIPYAGAPPIAPYDNAGWTLAYQMGVDFDRVLEPVPDGLPLEALPDEVLPEGAGDGCPCLPPGQVRGGTAVAGWALRRGSNDAFAAVQDLLEDGREVRFLTGLMEEYAPGDFWIPAFDGGAERVGALARERGIDFDGHAAAPGGVSAPLAAPGIALLDRYGGSMESGWTRFLFDEFDFGHEVVFAPDIDAGALTGHTVLVVPPGLVPEEDPADGVFDLPNPEDIPAEYRDRIGAVSVAETVPRILDFARSGGTVIAIGGSAERLAEHAELPLADHLVTIGEDGDRRPLRNSEFYVPGSVLRVRVDTAHPLGRGLPPHVDVLFRRSPVWQIGPDARAAGIREVAWFDTATPLRSGWAWRQQRLLGGAAIVDAPYGTGRLILFGPEVMFRGQSHQAFRMLLAALFTPAP